MSIFSKLSVSAKVYVAVATCLVALAGSSLFSIYQIDQIGKELKAIAEEDIPLTVAVTNAAASQLEQTIYFERILKSALEREMNLPGGDKFDYYRERFHEYGDAVDVHLKDAEKIAALGVEHALDQEMAVKFSEVLEKLLAIDEEHSIFELHADEVETLLASGDIQAGITLGEEVDQEAEKLDHEIEAVLRQISQYTAQSAHTAEQHEQSALQWLIIIAIVGILTVGPATIFTVQFSLPKPLRNVLRVIDRLADGKINDPVQVTSKDQIGKILEGLEGFRLKLVESKRLEEEVVDRQRKTIVRSEALERLNQDFEDVIGNIMGKVSTATNELNETAVSMSQSSEESSQKSGVIVSITESSSQNMQSVGSASEEMSASIGEIVGQTDHASSVAKTAVKNAENVRHQTMQMVENAQSISEVIALISGIAEQTNLLALNATIEAARAGESGKGFAVVASEVKGLATQTARATKDIGDKIESMQSVTQLTADAIESIVGTITDVNSVIDAIAGAVGEQNGAVSEINRNIQMASEGSLQINDEMRSVSQSINLTGDSAERVRGAADLLRDESKALNEEIKNFLAKTKAA